jgi:hypothetical protein
LIEINDGGAAQAAPAAWRYSPQSATPPLQLRRKVRFTPEKQKSFSTVGMFALCHFRTYAILDRAARLR